MKGTKVVERQEISFGKGGVQLQVSATAFGQGQVFKELAHPQVEGAVSFPQAFWAKAQAR